VGERDCPSDTRNRAEWLDLHTGKPISASSALPLGAGGPASGVLAGSIAVARAAGNTAPIRAASVSWDKPEARTVLAGGGLGGATSSQLLLSETVKGDPAMLVPTAISEDGGSVAFLVEPEPDEAHLNNRSSRLMVFGAQGELSYQLQIDGLGSTDPQVVAISAVPRHDVTGSGCATTYTVGAIMGSYVVVVDVCTTCNATSSSRVRYKKRSDGGMPEQSVAVAVAPGGAGGAVVAVTDGSDVAVIHCGANQSDPCVRIASIKPPSLGLGACTVKLARAGAAGDSSVLAVAWDAADGSQVGLTTHVVTATSPAAAAAAAAAVTVTPGWAYHRACSVGFDLVVSNGLAISPGAEFVVLGTWGCGDSTPNLVLLRGLGGDGQPLFSDTIRGQIWAADVGVVPSDRPPGDGSGGDGGSATAMFAAGSWTKDGAPAAVAMYSMQVSSLVGP
jgi:hypothetical protein